MNILFITLLDIRSVDERNIYSDLMREFMRNGHNVYVVSPVERKNNMNSCFLEFNDDEFHSREHILKIKIGNIQKTNVIEKGISTLLLESQLKNGIKKYLSHVKFDLILYSTPPITLVKPISFIKKRDNAKTYLMLKDIFPQNAVDIGLMSTKGLTGILYKFFRSKEKKLYSISDKIGCMSKANVDYILKNNPEISPDRVEVCPNCSEIVEYNFSEEEKKNIRLKFGIPEDKKVFVYGGNLGKPQDIPFVIKCLETQLDNNNAYFLIIGNGTEYGLLENFFSEYNPENMKLLRFLPIDEYEKLICSCDFGMIFLDFRFTIPNYPSRLISYMQAGLPVLAVTDLNSDIGKFLTENDIGEFCKSNDENEFSEKISLMQEKNYDKNKIISVLRDNFSSEIGYKIIMG